MLRQAAEAREQLVIGYVGNDGTVAERMVTPERVEGGQVTAYDERSDSQRHVRPAPDHRRSRAPDHRA